jgi:hypothetical protein
MEQQQAAQAEARQLGSSHAAELRQLRAQLAEREADCARLAAAEELYQKRNEELYKQVCFVQAQALGSSCGSVVGTT